MKFYDDYVEAAGMMESKVVPIIKVKFRDNLCLYGKKLPYEDFTKFVVRDGKYLPLFYVKDVHKDDLIIDMHPLISIGAIELLALDANLGDLSIRDFCRSVSGENLIDTKDKLKMVENAVSDKGIYENSNELLILSAMRSDYVTCSFTTMGTGINLLTCAYLSDKKLYAKAIMDLVKFSHKYSRVFTGGEIGMRSFTTLDVRMLSAGLNGGIPKSSLNPKRIGYTIPGMSKKHYISSCRGLGIYAFLILAACIWEKFSEPVSKSLASSDAITQGYKDQLQSCFKGCLGDDFIGSYYKTGVFNIKKYDKTTALPIILQNHVPMNPTSVYKLEDGSKVVRDAYENDILFKKAHRVAYRGVDGFIYRNSGTYYTDLDDLLGCAYRCFLAYGDDGSEDEKRWLKAHGKRLSEEYDQRLKSASNRLQERYKGEIETLKESHQKYCESADKKVEELSNIIASKSDIISKLTAELKEMHEKFDSYYCEGDESESVLEDGVVSLEEMVAYLNEFKLTMIGGRIDILQKLQEYGCTGVVQVDSETALKGTTQNTDFFCINTQFVAHKVIRLVESRYKCQKDQMFYFNGTNTEALIKSAYDFIKKWMDD